MICIFNRKKLLVTSDAGDVAQKRIDLKEAGIPFEVKTIRSRGTIGSSFDHRSIAASNFAPGNFSSGSNVYYIYVRKKDYKTALKCCKL